MERTRGESEIHRRRCLSCGHGGRSLQGERGRLIFSCPSCDADLYARPPMSYAEMEGLASSSRRRGVGWAGLLRSAWQRLVGRAPRTPIEPGRAAPSSPNETVETDAV